MSTAQLQGQIGVLEGQTRALEAQIRTMQQSTSWRVTAPLRWVSEHCRRVLRGSQASAPAQGGPYSEWIARYDTLGASHLETLRHEIGGWPTRPRLLVLAACGDGTGVLQLRELLDSLLAQLYPDWQLHLVQEGLRDDAMQRVMDDFAEKDGRIRPAAWQSAEGSAMADSDWVVWLDQGCTLPAHALFRVAKDIVEHPDVQMIYTDEDRIDASGARCNPFFKPDWDLDLFLARNLFAPLAAIRASLFDEVGGPRDGFGGAQGLELALRCVERLGESSMLHIRHIPHVLVHRHGAVGSAGVSGVSGVSEEAERALGQHFERSGIAAKAEATSFGFRIHHALPARLPLVSLVIPTRNALELVRQCVESIVVETAYPNYEILLVDNGSDDPEALAYFAALGRQQNITVIRDERPFNYSALNNAAVAQARGELVGLLNNDIEVVSPEWLDEMVSLALQPGVGAVGAKLLYPDRALQHGGVVLGVGGIAGHAHKHFPASAAGHGGRAQLLQSFSAVTAACLVVRKALYERVGGLDEERLGVAYNDVDFCLRLREAGFRNLWTPYAELLHHESATRGLEMAGESRDRLAREAEWMRGRWGELIANDPAYNPNLTLNFEDFDLAWPPRVSPFPSPHRQQEAARDASKP